MSQWPRVALVQSTLIGPLIHFRGNEPFSVLLLSTEKLPHRFLWISPWQSAGARSCFVFSRKPFSLLEGPPSWSFCFHAMRNSCKWTLPVVYCQDLLFSCFLWIRLGYGSTPSPTILLPTQRVHCVSGCAASELSASWALAFLPWHTKLTQPVRAAEN